MISPAGTIDQEKEKEVVEFIHLCRTKCDGIGILLVSGDIEEPILTDLGVARGIGALIQRITMVVGSPPSVFPIIGKIPQGTCFAGQKYAVKFVSLDEELVKREVEKAKEVALK